MWTGFWMETYFLSTVCMVCMMDFQTTCQIWNRTKSKTGPITGLPPLFGKEMLLRILLQLLDILACNSANNSLGYYMDRFHQVCTSTSGGWHLYLWHMVTWLSKFLIFLNGNTCNRTSVTDFHSGKWYPLLNKPSFCQILKRCLVSWIIGQKSRDCRSLLFLPNKQVYNKQVSFMGWRRLLLY